MDRREESLISGKMDESYKGHLIRYESRGSPDGWRPVMQVSWRENDTAKMVIWIDKTCFQIKNEAEKEARFLARRWIDDGKPNLEISNYEALQQ